MRHLAEVNYKKAAGLFLLLENPVDIMKVQLDRMVLLEEQIQGNASLSHLQLLWCVCCGVDIGGVWHLLMMIML